MNAWIILHSFLQTAMALAARSYALLLLCIHCLLYICTQPSRVGPFELLTMLVSVFHNLLCTQNDYDHITTSILMCCCYLNMPCTYNNMLFPLVYSTLTLYDRRIGSSQLQLTTDDSSLADNGWNNKASSAVVSGGCQWILYDGANYAENTSSPVSPSVIGPGSYPWNYWTTFGLPDNVLSSVRCLPAEGTPAIALFLHHHYFGEMQVFNSSNSHLALTNFDNTVSSFIITGGVWELYSGANYTGSMVTHGQGLYPTPFFLRPILNDHLTSVRLKVLGKKTNLELYFDSVSTY